MPGVWVSPFCAVFGGGVPGKGKLLRLLRRPYSGSITIPYKYTCLEFEWDSNLGPKTFHSI